MLKAMEEGKVSINNGRGMLGKHPSEETLRKLSESHKGKKQSKETRAKRSAAMKGKNGKPVILFTKEGELIKKFNSVKECANFIGAKLGTVSAYAIKNKVINNKYIVIYGTNEFD